MFVCAGWDVCVCRVGCLCVQVVCLCVCLCVQGGMFVCAGGMFVCAGWYVYVYVCVCRVVCLCVQVVCLCVQVVCLCVQGGMFVCAGWYVCVCIYREKVELADDIKAKQELIQQKKGELEVFQDDIQQVTKRREALEKEREEARAKLDHLTSEVCGGWGQCA